MPKEAHYFARTFSRSKSGSNPLLISRPRSFACSRAALTEHAGKVPIVPGRSMPPILKLRTNALAPCAVSRIPEPLDLVVVVNAVPPGFL
jgi:hypothetical protein